MGDTKFKEFDIQKCFNPTEDKAWDLWRKMEDKWGDYSCKKSYRKFEKKYPGVGKLIDEMTYVVPKVSYQVDRLEEKEVYLWGLVIWNLILTGVLVWKVL